MKPTSARAARRLAGKATKGQSYDELIMRVQKARVKVVSRPVQDRARRILISYLETTRAHGKPLPEVLEHMASGQTAWQLSHAVRDELMKAPPEVVKNAACGQGCAFCCILNGGDGGLITAFEAEQLHAALSPLAGLPDGRAWHPKACPALNPETRSCRAYDARPMICRSFVSSDADACKANAEGGKALGAGLLGNHLDYIAILALCRAVLKGITLVQTYSMAEIAASAVEGKTAPDARQSARHTGSALEKTCRDVVMAAGLGSP